MRYNGLMVHHHFIVRSRSSLYFPRSQLCEEPSFGFEEEEDEAKVLLLKAFLVLHLADD